ncbi:hypothetical protein EI555_014553 [Monodon monoceros]|uniref:Uncharacterized protein n=1 Tax=Monodon monoceros TaxID=40151 RepID=A0A4U1FET8_MONMO|nr:hypothetical protein EI555_014553 [Monodon monoceros]
MTSESTVCRGVMEVVIRSGLDSSALEVVLGLFTDAGIAERRGVLPPTITRPLSPVAFAQYGRALSL